MKKKTTKRILFICGLMILLIICGCTPNVEEKPKSKPEEEKVSDDYGVSEDFINGEDTETEPLKEEPYFGDLGSRELITINFTFLNSDCIEGRDLLFTYSEAKEIHATMYVYSTDTEYTMKFSGNDFILHSKMVGEMKVDVKDNYEFNITIDYAEKTVEIVE